VSLQRKRTSVEHKKLTLELTWKLQFIFFVWPTERCLRVLDMSKIL